MINFEKVLVGTSVALALLPVFAIILTALLIFSCSIPQTEDQIFDADQERLLTIERYYTCKAHKESRNQIWKDDTRTADGRQWKNRRPPPIWAMKIQMGDNNCGALLRSLDLD